MLHEIILSSMPITQTLPNIALDASARTYDENGRLHIAKTHITKATVNPYYGQEIPGHAELGLDPTRIYYLLRDPAELAKAAPTFERIQILSKHRPILNTDPPKEITIGTIGSEVEFNFPYLDADVCIWDADAIAGIQTETVQEWSCGYRYTAVMTPGVFEGQRYDGKMTEIRGDHLILTENGRAGSDVVAADEAIKTMAKMTKLGKALIVTLGGMSPKLALDSALVSLVGQAKKKTLNKGDLSVKLVALDAELDSTKIVLAIDALVALDAADDEDDGTAMDAEEKEEEEKKKKLAEDAEKEEEKKKVAEDNMKTAMDSFKRELRETDEARRAVRLVVGDVLAQDSAEGIYAFALDHLKVGHEGVTGVPALKALFNAAQPSQAPVTPRVALDSAGLVSRFPNAARFRQQ